MIMQDWTLTHSVQLHRLSLPIYLPCYRWMSSTTSTTSASNELYSAKEADEESSEIYNLANSILEECKQMAPVADLNFALYLLFQALEHRPAPHPQRMDIMSNVASALVVRFWHSGQPKDLQLAITLRMVSFRLSKNGMGGTSHGSQIQRNMSAEDRKPAGIDDKETDYIIQLANSSVKKFLERVSILSLDKAITLHREAFRIRTTSNLDQSTSVASLASALHSRFYQAGNIDDVDEAISLYRESLTSSSHPNQLVCLYGLCGALLARFGKTGQFQDLRDAVMLYNGSLNPSSEGAQNEGQTGHSAPPVPADNDTITARLSELIGFAISIYEEFLQTGHLSDLETAISLQQVVLPRVPKQHVEYPSVLSNLACFIHKRFKHTGRPADLEEVVSLHREALSLRPAPHPDRSSLLNNLANALDRRFGQTGQIRDIDEAIRLHREAMDLRPAPHPDRPQSLNNLANALDTRFGQAGQIEDIEEAIRLHREALALRPAPHPSRSASLNNLATALATRFGQTGKIEDVDEAIVFHREALTVLPTTPHSDRSHSLNNLASALDTRFGQTGQIEDIDEAIGIHHEALTLRPAPHPNRSDSLNNLANVLSTRSDQTGQIEDVNDAIRLHREALTLRPTPHADRSVSLNNLAKALHIRFGQIGEIEDINEGIRLHREALVLRPASHPKHSASLNNLASALDTRFRQTGQIEDVDEAIGLQREALMLRPAPHPGRSASLDNIGIFLQTRFRQTGQIEDINEAIELHRESLSLRHATHPDQWDSLNNLANALETRFGQTRQNEDMDEAVVLHQKALVLRPAPHPKRSYSLNNLAISFHTRFSQTGEIEDIHEAIKLHREALTLRPAPHSRRSDSLNNLANVLCTKFGQTGQVEDVDEAIRLHQEALTLRPAPHSDRSASLNNLARNFLFKYENLHQSTDIEHALDAIRDFVEYEYAPASQRFRTARHWVTIADRHPTRALEAYQATITLLPRIISLDLDLQSRHDMLASGVDGLARNAASAAIRSSEYGKAIALLEDGRSVFWTQGLQLRTPLGKLQLEAPDLAKEFRDISHKLEHGSQREVSWDLSGPPGKRLTTEQAAVHSRKIHRMWLSVLERIRKLDSFHDFLLPTPLNTLRKAATHGPVVILNASNSSCDALVMTLADIIHVPLPRCTFIKLAGLVKLTQIACHLCDGSIAKSELLNQVKMLRDFPRPSREDRPFKFASVVGTNADELFEEVLAIIWESVVKPIFSSLNLKKKEAPSRLWWCPTGPFSFLPIHAAGLYNIEGAESVFDYVVSSYIPSLKSLLVDELPTFDQFKVLAVIQPHVPSANPLPYTKVELKRIQEHIPNNFLHVLGDKDAPATVANVLSHLSTSHIVHFACHGKQSATAPLESGLILHDGHPLTVKEIMGQQMSNVSLAFLSACETAVGTEDLPDEAMHLAASLLFAGFRGVVATMWSIADEDGPEVADNFYEYLFRGTQTSKTGITHPKTTDAALALHHAVSKLRADHDRDCTFRRWVPFIHMGL